MQNDTLEAYSNFLNSLENFNGEESTGNIKVEHDENTLHFELIQGITRIIGTVTKETIDAYCLITKADSLHVAVKRRLLERNYEMTYSRFHVKDGQAVLKIHLDNKTMTPQKVFFPLRELALNADYEKEFIASEFDKNSLLDMEHVTPLDDEEKELKFRFMKSWIEECDEGIKRLPSNDNTGMIAFTSLTLLLQIDYLLVPKLQVGRKITERIADYFNNDEKLIETKNADLLNYIATLAAMEYETFAPQLYTTPMTFSPMERTTHEEVSLFIEETLNKIRWYKNNRYHHIIPTIYRYIALHLLYNYGLHPSLQALLHLVVEVQHTTFFNALGYDVLYHEEQQKFEKRQITARIEEALEPYQKQYKELNAFGNELDYSSPESFNHSFYTQIKHLNYTEI